MIIKKEDSNDKNRCLNKKRVKDNDILKRSAFNSPIFRSMLKYFKPEIKSKIIALQILDRFEMKNSEKNKNQDEGDNENNEDGNSRKVFI